MTKGRLKVSDDLFLFVQMLFQHQNRSHRRGCNRQCGNQFGGGSKFQGNGLPLDMFVAADHRVDQIFFLQKLIYQNRENVQTCQSCQQVEEVDVDFAHQAARVRADQMVQIAAVGKRVFIGGKQACRYLQQDRRNQRDDHQCAQRVVSGLLVFRQAALQVTADGRWAAHELCKPSRIAAPEAPTQAEDNQSDDQQPAAQVPNQHPAACLRAVPHKSDR